MEIKSLPQDIRDYLRSGENISSVSQCVMELVLNSLDAKATAIAVRVNLLTLRIQVVDNGHGVTKSNMNLIGTQYMTSKCHSLADLKRMKHFGFRGEALASICKMAYKLDIVSRLVGEDTTYGKTCEKGKWSPVDIIKIRPGAGTTITVTEFMYNFPVRQKRIHKHLDLEETKQRLEQLAIIYYNITFSLRNDASGKVMLQSKQVDNVARALVNFHSYISVKDLAQIKVTKNKVGVTGLIYKSSLTTTKLQLLYLNKRPIINKKIQKLINTLLTKITAKGEHPVYCLNIRCPYSSVDITMSPSKTTVEFKNWDIISKCIEKAVKSVLESQNLVPPIHTKNVCGQKAPSFRSQFGVSQIAGAVIGPKVTRNFVPESSLQSKRKKSKNAEHNTQTLLFGSDGSRHDQIKSVPSRSLTINLENQNKGKELIMDKFLKSTVAQPTEQSQTITGNVKSVVIEQTTTNKFANTTMTMTVISKKIFLKSSRPKAKNQTMISKCVQTTMVHQHKEFSPQTTVSRYFEKSKKNNSKTIAHFGNVGKSFVPRFGKPDYFLRPVSGFSQSTMHSGNFALHFQNPFPLYRPFGVNFDQPLIYSPYFANTRPFFKRQLRHLPQVRGNDVSSYFKTPVVDHNFLMKRQRDHMKRRPINIGLISKRNPYANFLIPNSRPIQPNFFMPRFKEPMPKVNLKTAEGRKRLSKIDLNNEKTKKAKTVTNFVPEIHDFGYQYPTGYVTENFNPHSINSNPWKTVKKIHNFRYPHSINFLDQNINAFNNFGHCLDQNINTSFNKDILKFGRPEHQLNFLHQNIKARDCDKVNFLDQNNDAIVLSKEINNFRRPSLFNYDQNLKTPDAILSHENYSTNFLDQNINTKVYNFEPVQPTTNVKAQEIITMGLGKNVYGVERPQVISVRPTNFFGQNIEITQESNIDKETYGQIYKSPFFAPNKKVKLNVFRQQRKCTNWNLTKKSLFSIFQTSPEIHTGRLHHVDKASSDLFESRLARILPPKTNAIPLISIQFQSSCSDNHNAQSQIPLFQEGTRCTDQPLLLNEEFPLKSTTTNVNAENEFPSDKSAENFFKANIAFFENSTTTQSHLNVPSFFLPEKDHQVFGKSSESIFSTKARSIKKHKSNPLAPRSRLSFKKHFSDQHFTADIPESFVPTKSNCKYHKFKPNFCSTRIIEPTLSDFEPLAVEKKKLDAVQEWIQQSDRLGNKFYINSRTGMTSVFSPKEVDKFTIAKRINFVPKGLSPMFIETKKNNVSMSPNSKKKFYNALMENYKNELQIIKWSNFISDETDVKDFFQKLYEEKTKQFENCIPNASRNQLPKSTIKLYEKVHAQSYPKDLLLNLDIIGQWDQKFIVTFFKTKQKLFLFDQHAASERIRLEKLFKGYKEKAAFKSAPYTMRIENFPDVDLKILFEFRNVFQNLGIYYTIRPKAVDISRIPTCLVTKQHKNDSEHLKNLVISIICEQLQIVKATRGAGSKIPQILQNVINSEACRGAIKFGDRLSLSECEEMIRELSSCQLPFQCAHGRPSLVPIITLDRDFSIKRCAPNLKKLRVNN